MERHNTDAEDQGIGRSGHGIFPTFQLSPDRHSSPPQEVVEPGIPPNTVGSPATSKNNSISTDLPSKSELDLIENFYGNQGDSCDDWLNSLNCYWEAFNWSFGILLAVIELKLQGLARDWWYSRQALGHHYVDWAGISQAFKARFGSPQHPWVLAATRSALLFQQPNESANEFFDRVVEAVSTKTVHPYCSTPMPPEWRKKFNGEVLDLFLGGLNLQIKASPGFSHLILLEVEVARDLVVAMERDLPILPDSNVRENTKRWASNILKRTQEPDNVPIGPNWSELRDESSKKTKCIPGGYEDELKRNNTDYWSSEDKSEDESEDEETRRFPRRHGKEERSRKCSGDDNSVLRNDEPKDSLVARSTSNHPATRPLPSLPAKPPASAPCTGVGRGRGIPSNRAGPLGIRTVDAAGRPVNRSTLLQRLREVRLQEDLKTKKS